MKKIVIINSSPRINGNCDILCSEFGRGAVMNEGNEVSRIDLKDIEYDFYREEQKLDELDNIAHQLIDADVIVLGTPVYFYNMSGMMKTLIDRMMPYFTQIADKDFYFILTAAVNKKEMEATAESLQGFTDSLPNANLVRVFYGNNVSQKGDVLNRSVYKEVFEAASKIL
ncbi:flavodoxin family protein [Ileibacterium valens]|uniref:flavodoxin family protein n=1 Tax=Ileibacterium valens TaxID=1862668 RepID=UPI002356B2F9|nr:NAD(P)H-dependent oxidoreductase [Ileibacterium valens]